MRIALVHDFLKEYGGAERVLEALQEIWPKAPIYTSFVDWKGLGPHQERIKKWKVIASFAQKIPYMTKIYSPLRILAPLFFESFDLSEYDVVISSTNAYYAKGIITKPSTIHICYCHTPPRSLYGYQTRMDWKKNIILRIYGEIINHFLRKYDYLAAQRVDYFIANSNVVKERIKKFYRKEAEVIYPPVELNKTNKSNRPNRSNYFLYVGKLAVAKNVGLAIEAAQKMGLRLKIVGKGAEEETGKVEFLGEVSDEQLISLYQNCRAVIFPALDEDFGIVPVEAMSFGKPVIALRSGGVVETVIDGVTGVLFEEPTMESLMTAIKQFNHLTIKPKDCIRQAKKFSKAVFQQKIVEFVNKVTK